MKQASGYYILKLVFLWTRIGLKTKNRILIKGYDFDFY